jgi:hypothetical protein
MIIMSMNKGKLKSLLKADLKHILFFGKVLVSIHVKKDSIVSRADYFYVICNW